MPAPLASEGRGHGLLARGPVGSEAELHTELQVARITESQNLAEGGRSDVRAKRPEIRVVENVECFGTKLEPHGFPETYVLRQREIKPRGRRADRSEERRVGKECRSRWSRYHEKKKKRKRRKDT